MAEPVWQNDIKDQLVSMQCSDNLHHAILFYNANEASFLEFLLSLGNALTASTKDYNPDIFMYNDHLEKNSIIPVDVVRNIINFVFKTSHYNQNKVVIIPGIEHFNHASANAFLKILEEPPKNVYFILSCSNLKNILPTVRSRCYKIKAVENPTNIDINDELYTFLRTELLGLNKFNLVKTAENIDKLKHEYVVILLALLGLFNYFIKNKLEFSDKNKFLEKYDINKLILASDNIKKDLKFLKQNMQLNKRSSIEGILYTLC